MSPDAAVSASRQSPGSATDGPRLAGFATPFRVTLPDPKRQPGTGPRPPAA
jgi:hypothetical protein